MKPIGFHKEKSDDSLDKVLDENKPKELLTYEVLLKNLEGIYEPCPKSDCTEFITTQHIFEQLQTFYPSDSYSVDVIVDTLIAMGWNTYYDDLAKAFFWQVRKL